MAGALMAGDLLTQLREHDLPPRWDGLATIWDGWEPQIEAFICPPPKQPSCCTACGSLTKPVTNRGRVARAAFITHDRIREHDEKRTRLGHGNAHLAGKPVALYRLHAFRCPDCKHDQVWDTDTDETYDLDHTDYGDEGSTEPTSPPAAPQPKAPPPKPRTSGRAAYEAARANLTLDT